MKTFALLSLFIILSCSLHESSFGETTDRATILQYTLNLETQANACHLTYHSHLDSGQLVLLPAPPCYFIRRDSTQAQSFAYADNGVKAVLIILGTTANEEDRALWNLPKDLVCGSRIQGIIITESGISASKKSMKGGVTCKDKGSDEKNFWSFAHQR